MGCYHVVSLVLLLFVTRWQRLCHALISLCFQNKFCFIYIFLCLRVGSGYASMRCRYPLSFGSGPTRLVR